MPSMWFPLTNMLALSTNIVVAAHSYLESRIQLPSRMNGPLQSCGEDIWYWPTREICFIIQIFLPTTHSSTTCRWLWDHYEEKIFGLLINFSELKNIAGTYQILRNGRLSHTVSFRVIFFSPKRYTECNNIKNLQVIKEEEVERTN